MSFIRVGNYTLSNPCATASFTVLFGEIISGTASVQGCDCSFLNFTLSSTRFTQGMTIGTVTDSCGITYTGYLSYKNGFLTLIILDSCKRAQEYVLSFRSTNIDVTPPQTRTSSMTTVVDDGSTNLVNITITVTGSQPTGQVKLSIANLEDPTSDTSVTINIMAISSTQSTVTYRYEPSSGSTFINAYYSGDSNNLSSSGNDVLFV